MRGLILAALLLISSLAHAEVTLTVGLGKGIFGSSGTPFERVGAIGYQFSFGDLFIRPEVGYFADFSGNGKSSFWGAPLIGVRTLARGGFELHIAVGPGYLQNPDQILGGRFQFSLEAGVEWISQDGKVALGLVGKHLSSAGFEQPNQGRDFFPMAQLRVLAF